MQGPLGVCSPKVTGARIRQIRESWRLTQTEFACLVGAHPISVSRWENSSASPTAFQLGLIEQFAIAAEHNSQTVDVSALIVAHGSVAALRVLLNLAAPATLRG